MSSEKSAMVARKGAYKYQSRATRTLASASSLPPLQHTEEAHEKSNYGDVTQQTREG